MFAIVVPALDGVVEDDAPPVVVDVVVIVIGVDVEILVPVDCPIVLVVVNNTNSGHNFKHNEFQI